MNTMRTCKDCKQAYPATLEHFYSCGKGRHGSYLQPYCKTCHKLRNVAHRTDADKARARNYAREYNRVRRLEKALSAVRNVSQEQQRRVFDDLLRMTDTAEQWYPSGLVIKRTANTFAVFRKRKALGVFGSVNSVMEFLGYPYRVDSLVSVDKWKREDAA